MSGLDLQAFSFEGIEAVVDSPEIFIPFGQTVPITIGMPSKFTTEIDGHTVNYQVTFESARLTRLTQIVNENRETGRPYNLVTGQFNNVEAKLRVNIGQNEDGTQQFVSMEEWIRAIVNSTREEATQISEMAWAEQCEAMGFRWSSGDMVMLWQHFGGSESKLQAAFDTFIEAGAQDITSTYDPDRLGRIRRIVTHNPGLLTTAFEIGQADRSRSQTQQGFEDLLSSNWDNFKRVIKMRTEAAALSKELAEIEKDEKAEPEDLMALRGEVTTLRRQSTRWVNNWAGSQVRTTLQADGSLSTGDEWDPQSIPCGRISVKIPVFSTVMDPETNEPVKNPDGSTQVVRSRIPMLDANEEPVMKDGQLQTLPESKVVEFDFWSAQDDLSDGPPASEQVKSDDEDDEDNKGF